MLDGHSRPLLKCPGPSARLRQSGSNSCVQARWCCGRLAWKAGARAFHWPADARLSSLVRQPVNHGLTVARDRPFESLGNQIRKSVPPEQFASVRSPKPMAIARPSASHSVSLRFLSAVVSRVAESSQSKQRCWFCTASLALGACLGLASIWLRASPRRRRESDPSAEGRPERDRDRVERRAFRQFSFLGLQTVHGSLSRIEAVNARGGVYGRKIKLISLDDGYEPARAVTNTQELLVDDDVFAVFDYVGTPTSTKIYRSDESRARADAGFFTGAEALRTPFRPFMFHVRDSYYAEAEAAVALFADQLQAHQDRRSVPRRRVWTGGAGGFGARDEEAQPVGDRHRHVHAREPRR